MSNIIWAKYPLVANRGEAREWLQIISDVGMSKNTVDAYGRGLNKFLAFCERERGDPPATCDPVNATRGDIASYVRHLLSEPSAEGSDVLRIDSGAGLSNSTIRQRLTAIRLWFDYLVEEGVRTQSPVSRGRFVRGRTHGAKRGLVPTIELLPWIPADSEWELMLEVVAKETLRNRLMFAVQYEGALRREELVGLRISDVDPAHRTIKVRPETTKGKTRGRHVTFSAMTAMLFRDYLLERARLGIQSPMLFVSESNRNRKQPITISTWDKEFQGLQRNAALPRFTSHTLRHLCLTDLARSNWGIKQIMDYAGHKNPETTMIYIHLSGRDIVHRFAKTQGKRAAQLAKIAGGLGA